MIPHRPHVRFSVVLRVETTSSVSLTDTLTLRLVATNPRSAPVVLRLECGHRGVTYQIRDASALVDAEPTYVGCPHSSAVTVTIAPADSLVRSTTWVPRPITTGLHALATPPGPYSAIAVLNADPPAPPSSPTPFTVVQP
jgi:hypothetical protein